MALYIEKISENEQKIQKLEESIKRDTAKKKKLTEENARLTYLSLCEQYNSSGRDLLDILASEHKKATINNTLNAEIDISENSVNEKIPGQTSFFNEN